MSLALFVHSVPRPFTRLRVRLAAVHSDHSFPLVSRSLLSLSLGSLRPFVNRAPSRPPPSSLAHLVPRPPTVIGLAPHPHTSPPRYPRPTRVVLPRTPRLPGRRDDPGTGSVSSLRGTVRRSTTLRSSLRFAQPPAGRMEREVMGSGRFTSLFVRPVSHPAAVPFIVTLVPRLSRSSSLRSSSLHSLHGPSVGRESARNRALTRFTRSFHPHIRSSPVVSPSPRLRRSLRVTVRRVMEERI